VRSVHLHTLTQLTNPETWGRNEWIAEHRWADVSPGLLPRWLTVEEAGDRLCALLQQQQRPFSPNKMRVTMEFKPYTGVYFIGSNPLNPADVREIFFNRPGSIYAPRLPGGAWGGFPEEYKRYFQANSRWHYAYGQGIGYVFVEMNIE